MSLRRFLKEIKYGKITFQDENMEDDHSTNKEKRHFLAYFLPHVPQSVP